MGGPAAGARHGGGAKPIFDLLSAGIRWRSVRDCCFLQPAVLGHFQTCWRQFVVGDFGWLVNSANSEGDLMRFSTNVGLAMFTCGLLWLVVAGWLVAW